MLYGKIDALAGLKYVLQTSDIRSVEAENALLWTDVYNMNGQLIRKSVGGRKGFGRSASRHLCGWRQEGGREVKSEK